MGVGMQIAYMGFAGSSEIESEASLQLIRLDHYAGRVAGCHLALESIHESNGGHSYDARLDLITRDYDLIPVEHMLSSSPLAAIHAAFDAAVNLLQKEAAHRERRNDPV